MPNDKTSSIINTAKTLIYIKKIRKETDAMQIMKPNAVLLESKDRTPYEHIEVIGRTCYKSEDKITEGSAVKFCLQMKTSRHYAMLEHYMIHMVMNHEIDDEIRKVIKRYNKLYFTDISKFLIRTKLKNYGTYLSGSFRTFLELLECIGTMDAGRALAKVLNDAFPEMFEAPVDSPAYANDIRIMNDEEFIENVRICKNGEDADKIIRHHITHTIRFTTDRGVSHEFVRHRPLVSFAQESTRYCNYAKGKFGEEIAVIEPFFYEPGSEAYEIWKEGCEHDEKTYFKLIGLGRTAQEARDNLPTSTKTDIIITTTEEEWQHIINLRYHGTTGAPHPQMKEVMSIAYPQLIAVSENRLQ